MRYVDLNCLNEQGDNYNYSLTDERLVLNIGSIGLPYSLMCRAEYLLLEIGDKEIFILNLKRVSYDNSSTFKRAIKNGNNILDNEQLYRLEKFN